MRTSEELFIDYTIVVRSTEEALLTLKRWESIAKEIIVSNDKIRMVFADDSAINLDKKHCFPYLDEDSEIYHRACCNGRYGVYMFIDKLQEKY